MHVIYTITNPAGERYVGASSAYEERRRTHKRHLRRGDGVNAVLQASWDRYGEKAHKFEVVASVPRQSDLHIVEAEIIQEGAQLNVNRKPAPMPGSNVASRQFGPHSSLAAFARASGLTYRQAKYFAKQGSYDDAMTKLQAKKIPRPPKIPLVGPTKPYWVVSENGANGSPAQLRKRKWLMKKLYVTVGDKTHTLAEWSKITGVSVNTMHQRRSMGGWTDAEIVGAVPRQTCAHCGQRLGVKTDMC